MVEINFDKLSAVLNGHWLKKPEKSAGNSVSIDSRTILPGEIFFAIKGKKYDGHTFISEVLNKKASVIICHNRPDVDYNRYDTGILLVKDTTIALGELAKYVRGEIKAKIVGITGSVGKTTTKNFIATILGCKYKVKVAEQSFNNFIGLPLTILGYSDEDFLVLELGTSKLGEIKYLAEIAKPDIAVITNIAPAHLEGLKNIRNIVKEKSSLLEYINNQGMVLLNADMLHFVEILAKARKLQKVGKIKEIATYGMKNKSADAIAIVFSRDKDKVSFGARYQGELEKFKMPVLGWWNACNFLPAFLLAKHFGISEKEIKEGLSKIKLPKNRMEKISVNGINIISDCYNASPLSMEFAINEFLYLTKNVKNRVMVLGDMLELGKSEERYYLHIGKLLLKSKVKALFLVGNGINRLYRFLQMRKHQIQKISYFPNVLEASEEIKKTVYYDVDNKKPLKNCWMLLKASRGIELEKLLEYL